MNESRRRQIESWDQVHRWAIAAVAVESVLERLVPAEHTALSHALYNMIQTVVGSDDPHNLLVRICNARTADDLTDLIKSEREGEP